MTALLVAGLLKASRQTRFITLAYTNMAAVSTNSERGRIMKAILRWVEISIVKLCDVALRMQDCAEDQNEINEIVALRNKMLRRINGGAL